jgi:hypothetical protein
MTWDTECATDAQVRADSVTCVMCCSVIFACTDATERKNHTLNMKRKDGEALSDPKAAVTKGTALAVCLIDDMDVGSGLGLFSCNCRMCTGPKILVSDNEISASNRRCRQGQELSQCARLSLV